MIISRTHRCVCRKRKSQYMAKRPVNTLKETCKDAKRNLILRSKLDGALTDPTVKKNEDATAKTDDTTEV